VKIGSIQALRAIAAWLVVLHHVHQFLFGFVATSIGGWFIATKGSVGVDLFFVISGFVMVVALRGDHTAPGDFLWRRLIRIAPAYWFWTAVFVAVLLAFPALIRDPFRLDSLHLALSLAFLASLFDDHFFPVLSVGWSLNFELFFYLLLAGGLLLANRMRIPHLERWVVPVLILGFVYAYPWRLPGVTMVKSKMLLMFLMGHALALSHLGGWLRRPRWLAPLLIGAGVAIILVTERNEFVLRGLACTAIVWGCLCLEESIASVRWLARLGDWSYSTYLVHVVVLLLATEGMRRLDAVPVPAWVGGSLLAILALSYVSHRYIELPTLRLGTRPRIHASA
jgi:exopolysaccharide production protein ExoZ